MAEAPVPFGAYLLVERLRGARDTFRAVPLHADGDGDERSASAVALKRIARERRPCGGAAALPGLFHKNLAAPLRVGMVEGQRFVASQLVEGRSLEELLRAGPLPVEAAAFVVAEVARGLGSLHRVAVDGVALVHRRVGPRTVLIATTGEVVLCGLDEAVAPAPRGDRASGDGGNGLSRAPEQLVGEPVDARTDVHALGLLLCHGAGAAARMEASDLDGGDGAARLPAALEELAARCLSVDRAARPASAAEVERALRTWLSAMGEAYGRADLARLAAERRALLDEDPPGERERVDDGEPDAEPASLPSRRAGWLSWLRDDHEEEQALAVGGEESPVESGESARTEEATGTPSPSPTTAANATAEPPRATKRVQVAAAVSAPRRRSARRSWVWFATAAMVFIAGAAFRATDLSTSVAEPRATSGAPERPAKSAPPSPALPRIDGLRVERSDGDVVLGAVGRALCRTTVGKPARFTEEDERMLAVLPMQGGGWARDRAAALVEAIVSGRQVVDGDSAAHLEERAKAGVPGLTPLRLLGRADASQWTARIAELGAPESTSRSDGTPAPAVAALCDRAAAQRALAQAQAEAPKTADAEGR